MIKPKKNNQIFYDGVKGYLDRGYDIMDSVQKYATENNIDVEVAGHWIKQSQELKEKFHNYAINNFLLKKETNNG